MATLTTAERTALSIDEGWIDAGYRRTSHLLTDHLSVLLNVRKIYAHIRYVQHFEPNVSLNAMSLQIRDEWYAVIAHKFSYSLIHFLHN